MNVIALFNKHEMEINVESVIFIWKKKRGETKGIYKEQ